MQGKNP